MGRDRAEAVLDALHEADEPLTEPEIARRSGLDKRVAGRAIGSLLSQGHVAFTARGDDRAFILTVAGRRKREREGDGEWTVREMRLMIDELQSALRLACEYVPRGHIDVPVESYQALADEAREKLVETDEEPLPRFVWVDAEHELYELVDGDYVARESTQVEFLTHLHRLCYDRDVYVVRDP